MHPTKPGHTVFAYVIEGKGCFCQQKDPFAYEVEGRNYFDIERSRSSRTAAGALRATETSRGLGRGDRFRFLLMSGKPIGEPVAWYGPIVMNTQEELRIAFEEYRNGTFIKHPRPA